MTAPHVIERLKNENNWLIVAKNDHEIALIHNYLFDIGKIRNFVLCGSYLDCGLYKFYEHLDTLDYSMCCKKSRAVAKNLTDWFFKEVNNY